MKIYSLEIACHLGSITLPLVYVGTAEAPLWQNDTNVNEYYYTHSKSGISYEIII